MEISLIMLFLCCNRSSFAYFFIGIITNQGFWLFHKQNCLITAFTCVFVLSSWNINAQSFYMFVYAFIVEISHRYVLLRIFLMIFYWEYELGILFTYISKSHWLEFLYILSCVSSGSIIYCHHSSFHKQISMISAFLCIFVRF